MSDSRALIRFCRLSLAALLLLCAVPALAAENTRVPADTFIRFIEGDGEFIGDLQTAVTSYRNSEGVELDLVAAVHLAESDYYDTLNEYFDTRDAVLYELVADESVRPDGTQRASGGGGVIGFMQTGMSRLLGLDFQLDSINYAKPNFIHADLEPDELDRLMTARGETFLSQIVALALAEMAYQDQLLSEGRQPASTVTIADLVGVFSMPDRRQGFKYLLGKSLIGAEGMLSASGGGITILDDRNAAALEALRVSLAEPRLRRISIFYGAAHMPGLEVGIRELGFERESQNWLSAWRTQ